MQISANRDTRTSQAAEGLRWIEKKLGHAAVVKRVIAADLLLILCGWTAENGWGSISLVAAIVIVAILMAALARGR